MDLMLPPPIKRVIEVVVKFLNRAIYQPRNVSLHSKWVKGKKKRCDSSQSESDSESSEDIVSDLLISSPDVSSMEEEDNELGE